MNTSPGYAKEKFLTCNQRTKNTLINCLKWRAIDLKNGVFRIERTVVKSILNDGAYYKDSTKTETSASEFPILADVLPLLQEIAEKQKANRELFGNTYYESDYVFTWDDGRLIQPDYVSKRF